MNILENIISYKKQEVESKKALYPIKLLERGLYFDGPCISMKQFLLRSDKRGIIAEFKRRSPSKGDINRYALVEEVSIGYMQAGAAALSILSDQHFFGGSNADLSEARKYNYAPILNKNFIIDEYQILEAKSIGADVILLIAACLTAEETRRLAQFSKSLGMEVLLEIHSEAQLDKLCPEIDLLGINNRNLENFEQSIENSYRIGALIPDEFLKISESGIDDPEIVFNLAKMGFKGFLIGEHFMREARPEQACLRFHQQLEKIFQAAELSLTCS